MNSQETMEYTKWIAQTGLLLALTLAIQILGLPQPLTGPLINTMLIVSAFLVGKIGGGIIGGVTPWIALMRGILPAVLTPMVPFIMVGNVLYVLGFDLLITKNKYLAIIVAAFLKFIVLAGGVRFIVEVPPEVAQMMQLPQLLTALAGGFFALFVIEFIKKTDII